jgi:hypothetical protein
MIWSLKSKAIHFVQNNWSEKPGVIIYDHVGPYGLTWQYLIVSDIYKAWYNTVLPRMSNWPIYFPEENQPVTGQDPHNSKNQYRFLWQFSLWEVQFHCFLMVISNIWYHIRTEFHTNPSLFLKMTVFAMGGLISRTSGIKKWKTDSGFELLTLKTLLFNVKSCWKMNILSKTKLKYELDSWYLYN